MRVQSPWVAAVLALVVVAGVVAVVASLWNAVGDSAISPAGWLALGLGVLVTLGLGIGLMALVFISSRRGYDDEGGGGRR